MTDTRHEQAGAKLPSPSLIALAFAVLQAKPEELSIGEHIRLLNEHIREQRCELSIHHDDKHFDQASFWRSEHDRVRHALGVVEADNYALRSEVETLRSKLDIHDSSGSGKRRLNDSTVESGSGRSPKKRRGDTQVVQTEALALDKLEAIELLPYGVIGNMMLLNLSKLHTTLCDPSGPDPERISYYIMRVASALPQVVQQYVQSREGEASAGFEDIRDILNVASRIIATITSALKRLDTKLSGMNSSHEALLHTILRAFRSLIGVIETLSAIRVKSDNNLEEASSASRSSRSRSSKRRVKTTIKRKPPKPDAKLTQYTAFLCSIFDQLDSKQASHRIICEGLAYCVLEKVGTRLYTTTFGYTRGLTLESEILTGAHAAASVENLRAAIDDNEKARIALEAPYWVHLLKKVLTVIPPHMTDHDAKVTTLKQSGHESNSRNTLPSAAKERLQGTLLNCMFGTEAPAGVDFFPNSLQLPLQGTATIPFPKSKEPDMSNWFQDEVWRLLGWDILAQRTALAIE